MAAPAPTCPTCKLVHPPLVECVEAMRQATKKLLLNCGQVDRCDCGATIFWLTHLTGKKAPYTEAGLVHFIDCTGKFSQK
jgi:hypothetical protein